jgi:hypothetical protein
MRRIVIAVAALACGSLLSFDSSHGTVSLAIDSAQARVGRPLTPVSAAGVAPVNEAIAKVKELECAPTG